MSNVDELVEEVARIIHLCGWEHATDYERRLAMSQARKGIKAVLEGARDWRPEDMAEVDWINRSWEWRIDALLAELEDK